MEGVSLTRGAIADITNGTADNMKPVLQVVDLKPVQTVQNTDRFRMVLSDGVHAQQAMVAAQMNGLVKSGTLQKGSVVQLNEFICSPVQNRKIIIALSLDVIVEKCNIIGEPRNYDGGSSTLQGRSSLPAPSSVDQPGTAAGNLQSHGGSLAGGSVAPASVSGGSHLQPKLEPMPNSTPYGGLSTAGSISSRNGPNGVPLYNKAEVDGRSYGEAPQSVNHNQRFPNPGAAGGRPPINNYGRMAQSTYQQSPPPLYTNRGPIAKNEAPARIVPIAALNPYQGRWTIKARVTAKGDLRRYNNPKGEGKVFSFDLLDSEGGEIRVTCFNMVADQFYDQIEVGKVYFISKGSLKAAQKNFNHLNNEYEITLDATSTIEPCLEDSSIPKQQFNFRPISDIEGMENNSMVDVIGIVSSISPSSTIMRKNGTETHKRSLQLKDMSGRSVELTFWGNFCIAEGQQLQEMCDSGVFPVLAVKASRVSDFSGKSLGTISSSQLFINPDFPEGQQLKEWYDREGKCSAVLSISRDTPSMGRTDARKTVSQIKDEGLGRSEKPDWITVKATATFIKVDNFCYTACPLMVGDRQCNKKVNNNGDGTWRCDRCDQCFPECDYRYILQLQIQDHTGLTWVTAFQECGEEIMGVPAKELYLLKYEEQDDAKFAEVIRRVLFNEYLFKLKVKEETFSDEQRVKSTVVKAEMVNPSSESRYLSGLIDKLLGEDPSMVPGRSMNIALESGRSNAGYSNVDFKPGSYPVGNSNVNRFQVETPNHMGQHFNGYGSSMGHNIGTRVMQVLCNSCGSADHSSQNCPRVMNGQGPPVGGGYVNMASHAAIGGGGSASTNCFKCQQPGHFARDCPGSSGGNASTNCFKCQQPGHFARDCPGSSVVPPVYGSNSMPGRYGFPKQQLGGY